MSAARLDRQIGAVAIGASSGGVEALSAVLPAIPASAGVAVFVVVHLPPGRPSLLEEIFAARCQVAVEAVQDKLPVRPGSLYFAPPDYHLLVEAGSGAEGPCVALSRDEPVQFSRPSVDVLFESLADVYRSRLLAVVLTGAGSDGSAGVRRVRERGGLVAVQDPATANTDGMPLSAARAVTPDFLLPLPELARLLSTLNAECVP